MEAGAKAAAEPARARIEAAIFMFVGLVVLLFALGICLLHRSFWILSRCCAVTSRLDTSHDVEQDVEFEHALRHFFEHVV